MISNVNQFPTKIAIAGDGQLARFIALAAKKNNIETTFLTNSIEDSPCKNLGNLITTSSWNNEVSFKNLIQNVNVLILENEFLPPDFLKLAEDKNICCFPNFSSYEKIEDKLKQVRIAQKNDVSVPAFRIIEDEKQLSTLQLPKMLKAIKHGYDGYGNFLFTNNDQLPAAKSFLTKNKIILAQDVIAFDQEVAITCARDYDGNIIFFPAAHTLQENHICHFVFAPAPISPTLLNEIQHIAKKILNDINAVGVFAFEFFIKDQSIIFNEIAPRPHNSAHFTIDACNFSQFDAIIKLVLKQKLTSTVEMRSPYAGMLNLLGTSHGPSHFLCPELSIESYKNCHLHLYHKKESKIGRKMGHITTLGTDLDLISKQLKVLKSQYRI